METNRRDGRRVPSLGRAVRHHLVVVLLATLGVTGVAVAYVMTSVVTYTSSAVLLLSPVPGNPLSPGAASSSTVQLTVAMETEAGMVSTPVVAEEVSSALGRQVPGPHERLRAQASGGTQMLTISFTSTTPAAAREGAQAFARGFLQHREENATANVEAALSRLREQVEVADEALREAAAGGDEENSAYAAQEVQLYADRLTQLHATISETRSQSTNPGRILNPAEAPTNPAGLPPALLIGAAGLVGVVLGAASAVLLEWRRDLIRRDEESEVAGVPVFAHIPEGGTSSLLTGGDGDTDSLEAYRRLRAGVVANTTRHPHVLAVSGVGQQDSSTVTVHLARALADAGFAVLLVSANPWSRRVEEALGIPSKPGLAEVVLDRMDPDKVVVTAGGIALVPGGGDPERARELYGGPAFRAVITKFRQEYDYVLVNAAGTGLSDGDAAIAAAETVLLVLTNDRTTHAQVGAALDRFDRLGMRALGAVSVPPERSGGSHGDSRHLQRRPSTDVSSREGVDAILT